MKLTKNSLKQLIKEELEAMQEQEPGGLSGTYNFVVRSGDRNMKNVAYITNVPANMLDTPVDADADLKLSPEVFKQIMGRNRNGYFYDMRIREIPETVEVEATFNLRTGELVEARVPKLIDAGGM